MSWKRCRVALAIVCGLGVLVLFPAAGTLCAQDAPDVEKGGGGATDEQPHIDPFRVLIVKQAPVRQTQTYVPKVVAPPPVPTLKLKVNAIAGEAPNYVAVITYNNAEYIVEKEWEPMDKKFKVVSIAADKVEVYFKPTSSRKVFHF